MCTSSTGSVPAAQAMCQDHAAVWHYKRAGEGWRRLVLLLRQATDARINIATAVLRGLIYILVDRQRSLLSH